MFHQCFTKFAASYSRCLIVAFILVKSGNNFSHGDESKQNRPDFRIKQAIRWTDKNCQAGLGDEIEVKVERLSSDKTIPINKRWILFFNGVPLPGIYPDNVDVTHGTFRFYLSRDGSVHQSHEDLLNAWKTLLRGWYWHRPVSVALGTETEGIDASIEPLQSGFNLTVIAKDWKLACSVFLAIAVLLALAALGTQSNLLRDNPPVMIDKDMKAPFSLGKVQWAWWIVLILYAYLAIGLVTWDYFNVFSTTALALLGISTGTALGAGVIGSGAASRLNGLQKDIAELKVKAANSPDNSADKARFQEETRLKEERLSSLQRQLSAGSRGFFLDIMSDDGGISLHRFQIVVWTITLGLVFVIQVWHEKSMPDFNANLLALMGISSGAYLAFKVPEVTQK
ncbi:MAG: hypothetical protein U1D30_06280 [Planctomycetota bacterium]